MPARSWQRSLVALESDIGDIQGGTTREGIHLGVMAGTLDLVQRAYLGVEIRNGVVSFNPTLVDRLDGLSLPMQVRHRPVRIDVRGAHLTINALPNGFTGSINVAVGEVVRELGAGERATFRIDRHVRGEMERAGPRRPATRSQPRPS